MKSYKKLSCAASAEICKWSTWVRLIQAKMWPLGCIIMLYSLFKMEKNYLILMRRKRKDCLKILWLGFSNQDKYQEAVKE